MCCFLFSSSEVIVCEWEENLPVHFASILVTIPGLTIILVNTTNLAGILVNTPEGGLVAQSVEGATPGEEVPGSIPAVAARSLLVGSVSV